ncbi:MAG: hypothetical protein WC680_10175 [Sulfuricurvum sp.]|jgi:hypothetical protein
METRVISAEENKVTVCGEYTKIFMALQNVLIHEGATFTIWDQSINDLEVQFKDDFRILINVRVLDFCLWLFTFKGDSLGPNCASQILDDKAKELAINFSSSFSSEKISKNHLR